MARHEITMPQLGESVTEGTVTRWLKQPGDRVEVDELLFEVSTDKVDSEVPSPNAGYLVEILVPEGETVDVGQPLCVVADEAGEAGEAPAPAADEPAASAKPPTAEAPPQAPPPPEAASAEAPSSAPSPATSSKVLSPVVRRLISEHGLDPEAIPGTGTGGRITRSDVLAFVESVEGSAPPPVSEAAPPPKPAPAPPPAAAPTGAGDRIIPFSNIRKRTAEHMVRSKATSPHALMVFEVDFEKVETVRAAVRDDWRATEGFSLTYLPFIARAVCDTIREFPIVNASVEGENLHVHGACNLGVAVDLDFQGLVVPVVRDAETKRLRQIAREIRDLAERARSKRLSPDDLMGGTFTLTNAGPYGTLITGPIISQPQVAILSTDGVAKRPVVVEGPQGDAIAIHHVANLCLTWDHRAFDGAYSGAFLRRLKEIIETRDWSAEVI